MTMSMCVTGPNTDNIKPPLTVGTFSNVGVVLFTQTSIVLLFPAIINTCPCCTFTFTDTTFLLGGVTLMEQTTVMLVAVVVGSWRRAWYEITKPPDDFLRRMDEENTLKCRTERERYSLQVHIVHWPLLFTCPIISGCTEVELLSAKPLLRHA